jgi:CRP/FNR family transcriptional regulator, cyclic AMP receptor protein
MSDAATVEFLAGVPLFEGLPGADLGELAPLMRRRTAPEGEVLWQQGDDAREMAFIVEGRVAASLRVPGNRSVDVGSAGPGGMVGELALLDSGERTMSVRVTEPATVLTLSRLDFAALLAGRQPSAFSLRRRLASHFAAHLRSQLSHLADSLGHGTAGPVAADVAQAFADLEYCRPPDSKYVRRMATFHDFDPAALWGFLTAGRYARCGPGQTLLAEGEPSAACFLVINGAVEKAIVRGDRSIRVGLAGPGKLFGYEGLVDGGPSPVTATTRERVLLLVIPKDGFAHLFTQDDAISRVFLDVILRDMVVNLRQTLRPLARQAYSRPANTV